VKIASIFFNTRQSANGRLGVDTKNLDSRARAPRVVTPDLHFFFLERSFGDCLGTNVLGTMVLTYKVPRYSTNLFRYLGNDPPSSNLFQYLGTNVTPAVNEQTGESSWQPL